MIIFQKSYFIHCLMVIASLTSLSTIASEPKKTIANPHPITIYKSEHGLKNFVKNHQAVSISAAILNTLGAFLYITGRGRFNSPQATLICEMRQGLGQSLAIAGTLLFGARYGQYCYNARKYKQFINQQNSIE